MDVVNSCCAGLDVHKKTVTATVIVVGSEGELIQETRTFSTLTCELLGLSDWLSGKGVTHVAMESTGEYWKPVYNILEGAFELLLVNAQHVKAVPGRKTDVKDAEWLAQLLRHGLVRPSFVPPPCQRALRELVRTRITFVRERATLVNRVQKVLESANIKLGDVASDVMGVSGKAMLAALIEGKATPEEMADLSRGQLRDKQEELAKALEGRVQAHHRFILKELLCQIGNLDDTVERFDKEIEERCREFAKDVDNLDTIPGVNRATAEVILAEIGTDMSRFPSAHHLASWAGVAPGNNESAGKRQSGKTRKGNKVLRATLNQAAHAAARTKNTYLSAQYHRLAARRGRKKAIMAVAHSILVAAYHIIKDKEPYKDLGGNFFDKLNSVATAKRLVKRLRALGYAVFVAPPAPAAA
jgi:transposase